MTTSQRNGRRAALALPGRAAYTAALCSALTATACARLAMLDGLSASTIGCAVLGAGTLFLLFSSRSRTRRSAAQLRRTVDAMRQGDLSRRVEAVPDDEFAGIGRSIEDMNSGLSALVAHIRSQSTYVSQAGDSLASGTTELAERTDRQASSLQQTSAGVQQLSGSVQQNADDARAVEQLASRVHGMAESGGERMREAVASMRAIKASSDRVQDIIGAIDGIAFQTNILALNAAVEAARAGENGRGFAIVAAEVRTLALRSGTAAREIKDLISASATEVEAGASRIDEVGALLSDVVTGIGRVAGNVRAITAAAEQQSAALVQMTQAIRGLDDITHQNARMVEETSTASASLRDRARSLAGSVGGFRLRQGTADEAHALARRAAQVFARKGRGCLDEITDAASGFVDRDMYVFAWDRELVYHAFAGKPHNVRKRAEQILGTDVSRLRHDVWAVPAGGGWVDYDFLNPATGQVAPKTSFIIPVSADLVLGCGVYKTVQRP